MAVYVDKLRRVTRRAGWRFSHAAHLVADSVSELHEFASRIGLKQKWFQAKASTPHYDLTSKTHAAALRAGAVVLERREFVAVLQRMRVPVRLQREIDVADPMWLGRFPAICGEECQTGCGERIEFAAAWIYRGEVLVLAFCDACSRIAQERSENPQHGRRRLSPSGRAALHEGTDP